jgi:hypothetical protein
MVVVHIWRTLTLLGAVLTVLVALHATSPNAESFTQGSWRPYSNPSVLVNLGMSKGEVLVKAGPPALDEIISHGTDGHVTITAWTYIKTGHNASVTVLTFQGNKLVRIEVTLTSQ